MSGTKSRRGMAALLCVFGSVFSAACTEGGLPGKNRPYAEAAHSEWRYPPYEKSPTASKLMQVGGHTWQVTGATQEIPAHLLQPVADVNGQQIFSLKSDGEPYNVLYTAGVNGRYSVVSNIN